MDTIILTGAQLTLALHEFQDKWKTNKDIERIEYSDWRNLVKCCSYSEIIFQLIDSDIWTWSVTTGNSCVISFCPPCEFIDIIYKYGKIKKENDTMSNTFATTSANYCDTDRSVKMPAMNLEFGPVSENIAISPYGLAVRAKNGNWMTYNPATNQTIDVTGFTFNFGRGLIYKIPVAINAVAKGDMIMHQGRPMYVTFVNERDVDVIDILNSEAKTVIPVTNMFGFNFVTKIMPLVNFNNGATPSPDQPFGNLMPMIAMSMLFDGDGDNLFGDMDMGKLVMMSAMFGGQNPLNNIFNFQGFAGLAPTSPAQ